MVPAMQPQPSNEVSQHSLTTAAECSQSFGAPSCRFSLCTRSHNKVLDSVYINRYTRNTRSKKTISFSFKVPPLTETRTFLTVAWKQSLKAPTEIASHVVVTLFSMFWNLLPLRVIFPYGNRKRSTGERLGELGWCLIPTTPLSWYNEDRHCSAQWNTALLSGLRTHFTNPLQLSFQRL